MSQGNFGAEEIRQESSWRYPLGLFLITLVLSAVFLYHYVGPGVDEISGNTPKPTISDEITIVTVGGVDFAVPANYTIYPRARRGGEREQLSLYAMWPTLTGYAPSRREEFIENAADTRRIDIVIEVRRSPFTERDRLERLYLPLTLDPQGERSPYELIKYQFAERRPDTPTNGYADKELYVGAGEAGGQVVLMCFQERDDIPSPECFREYAFNDRVTVTYRFKRPYLPEWRAIDARVRAFVEELAPGASVSPAAP